MDAYMFWQKLLRGFTVIFTGFGILTIIGCSHSFKESQLVGSWQLDVQNADVRFTYYPNHTWIMTITGTESLPSESEFGEWKLEGDSLMLITRSGLDDKVSNVQETGKIRELNNSVLVELNQDANGKTRTSSFHRVGSPSPSVSDDEFAQRLVGTWRYSYTNTAKLAGVLLYSSYQKDGRAFWHGTIYKESGSISAPKASGNWQVENGFLKTTITNSQPNGPSMNQGSQDEIISVTDSQFTYRDEQGVLKKVNREKSDQ
jgi:hypothetical protein